MKILKTLAPFEDGLYLVDTIEHEGKLWLVPEWYDNRPSKGYSMPVRIICLSTLAHGGRFGEADYTLKDPIPTSVWNGQVEPESERT